MMSRVREEIQRRLIILQINKIRHERAAANLSSPDLQRYRASLSVLGDEASIVELEWVLQIMLALAMDRAFAECSLLGILDEGKVQL